MKSIVSEKGQITIPKKLREALGIRPGQVLKLNLEGGRLIATKAPDGNPFGALYGILELERPTDELIAELRDPE